MVKITHFSDTHGLHREVKIPNSDLLIFSGDLSNIGELLVLKDFNNWLGEQGIPCVVIAGNHDFCFQKQKLISKDILTNAIYLENTGIIIDGLTIWGSPLTSTFPQWAFVDTNEDNRKTFWKMIPENLDILVTHSPPLGILDEVPRPYHIMGGKENCGDGMLLAEVMVKKPQRHLFGHIHEGYGNIINNNGTIFTNSSICDALYRPVNKPQTFILEPRT